jgi:hypothetical protein
LSQKIQYKTIIFPEHVYDEIQKLRVELSRKDRKTYSISNTINLLLRFCFDEGNCFIFAQDYSFFRDYMYEKESFLEDFISSVFISAY